jgi:hypothetical protein
MLLAFARLKSERTIMNEYTAGAVPKVFLYGFVLINY